MTCRKGSLCEDTARRQNLQPTEHTLIRNRIARTWILDLWAPELEKINLLFKHPAMVLCSTVAQADAGNFSFKTGKTPWNPSLS
jgi:hypothetical protein